MLQKSPENNILWSTLSALCPIPPTANKYYYRDFLAP